VGEMKFPAALFNSTSTFQKISERLVAYFRLHHSDERHIVMANKYHLFQTQTEAVFFSLSKSLDVMATLRPIP
jgi:hypothetical protein